jgi:hypothetical protein
MAADRRLSDNSMRWPPRTKIHQVNADVFCAVCGDHGVGEVAVHVLQELVARVPFPRTEKEAVEYLTGFAAALRDGGVTREDSGSLIVVDRRALHVIYEAPHGRPGVEVVYLDDDNPFVAFGTGREYAMGAMAAGAPPNRAVQLASGYDVSTGDGVTYLHHGTCVIVEEKTHE